MASADVMGAYLDAELHDFTLIKFTDEVVDILCSMNPAWDKLVIIENGTKVLYLRLLKALYGCAQSALLWYELFSTTLQEN